MKFVVLALLGLVSVSAEEPVAAETAVTAVAEVAGEDLDEDEGALAEDDGGVAEQEEGAFNLSEQELDDEGKPKKKGKKGKKSKSKGKKKGSKGKKAKKSAKAAAPVVPKPTAKGGNPDANRKVFDQHVAYAGQVVKNQVAFEAKKTAEIDTANKKAIS